MTRNNVQDSGARLDPNARRLLRALGPEGAYGYVEAYGPDARMVVVVTQRKGVSVRAGSHSPSAALALGNADLAHWRQADGEARQRLFLSESGRARCDREAAGDDHPFVAQHTRLRRAPADDSPDAAAVLRDLGESPLARLATRKDRLGRPLIDVCALEAGERLRRDLTLAQILPRVTSNWSAAVASGARGGGELNMTELTLAARQRVDLALDALGSEFAGLLVDICGFLKGLELIETERGWPQRSAKVVVVMALAQLARHYGISAQAVGPIGSRGVRQWGAADFRPRLSRSPPD